MDIAKADSFIYHDCHSNKTYISKDLNTLLEKVPDRLVSICKAIVNTESGPMIFDMDEAYSGEPIIMRRFMHYDSYMGYYRQTIVEL